SILPASPRIAWARRCSCISRTARCWSSLWILRRRGWRQLLRSRRSPRPRRCYGRGRSERAPDNEGGRSSFTTTAVPGRPLRSQQPKRQVKGVQMSLKVGYIGVGRIGTPMAANVMRDFPLIVYDLRQEALDHFAKLGATIAKSPKEVGEFADIIEL